ERPAAATLYAGESSMDRIKTAFVSVFFCLALIGCNEKPQPTPPPAYLEVSGTNLTSDYLTRFNAQSQPDLPPELTDISKYNFIFVRGIMGDFVTFLGEAILNEFGQFQYFDDQMAWLDSLGVENHRISLHTEASVEKNAKVIAKAIRKSKKPVVVIAHS